MCAGWGFQPPGRLCGFEGALCPAERPRFPASCPPAPPWPADWCLEEAGRTFPKGRMGSQRPRGGVCGAAGKGWPRTDERDAGPGSPRSAWGRGGWHGFVTGMADVSRAARGAGPGAGATTCFSVLFPHLGMSLGGGVGPAQAAEVGRPARAGSTCSVVTASQAGGAPGAQPSGLCLSSAGPVGGRGAPQGSGELPHPPCPRPSSPLSRAALLCPW